MSTILIVELEQKEVPPIVYGILIRPPPSDSDAAKIYRKQDSGYEYDTDHL